MNRTIKQHVTRYEFVLLPILMWIYKKRTPWLTELIIGIKFSFLCFSLIPVVESPTFVFLGRSFRLMLLLKCCGQFICHSFHWLNIRLKYFLRITSYWHCDNYLAHLWTVAQVEWHSSKLIVQSVSPIPDIWTQSQPVLKQIFQCIQKASYYLKPSTNNP